MEKPKMEKLSLGRINNRIMGLIKKFKDANFREVSVYEDDFLLDTITVA